MATHMVVWGHGAGDPGAGGNGYNERDFTRNRLAPYFEKYAKMLKKNTIVFYNKNLDMYRETIAGRGAYQVSRGYLSVTEFHLDAAGAAATGGHVIISKAFSPDSYDLAIANVIKSYVGWWGSVQSKRGVNGRSDLLNLNVLAKRGISYRLVELGFITNKKDMTNINNNLDAIAKAMVEAITGEKIMVAKPPVKPTPPKPTAPSKITNKNTFANGSKVVVSKTATTYQTGQRIASFVKGATFTVQDRKLVNQSQSQYAFLLKEIQSWVLAQDLTAYKAPVSKNWSKDYYTTNPGRVKLKVADGLRAPNDVNFTGNANYGGRFPAGTVFVIKGIKKRKDGLPRLITQSGFLLTANKKYVQKI